MNDMNLMEFIEFAFYAKVKETEELLYQEWLALLPHLKPEYMNFKRFKEHKTGADIDRRPAKVIIAEIKELHRKVGMDGS